MFLETSMTPKIAYGFKGGPQFHTTIVTLASGREQRNIDWSRVRHAYSCPFNNIDLPGFLELKRLFIACYGQANGFRFKDYCDFTATNEAFGTGNGVQTVFQLYKISVAGASSVPRRIVKPVAAGFSVKVNGTPATASVDTTTGLVTFSVAPVNLGALTWTGTFDVPVRFAMDYLPFSMDELARVNGSVDLIEDPEA